MYKNIKKFGALLLSLLLVIGVSSQLTSKAFAEEKAEIIDGSDDTKVEKVTSFEPIEQSEIQHELTKIYQRNKLERGLNKLILHMRYKNRFLKRILNL
ncbi:hypothetical protein [Peribacillus frigoritolerans]|uniref:hypothetical protein n=1 Tax=Peribacillus frigoritolerans TaxID=450367 RepID=UPI002282D176|nr:hypothetical protein [Peribacillus frigoritolerans]MCY9139890.1 hypothetical protein [Peribacillus frigoritolerans]